MEIWKDINGFEGLYQVSNCGNVKRVTNNKMLVCAKNNRGYLNVGLYLNGKQNTFAVHRLVAKAFLPNPHNLPCVNHKDENKGNNCVDNLEWCSYQYNNTYGTRLEKSSKSKFKPVLQYSKSNEFMRCFASIQEAEKSLKISHSHISDCCNGKRKSAGGYKWTFKKAAE